MFGIKNSDLLFYFIALIGFILVFGGIPFMPYRASQETAFNIIMIGYAIIFADVIWYEIYFYKNKQHRISAK